MADQSPGFYFNVEEWRGSRSVGRMSMSERGVYLEMMIEQWLRRTLPDDAQQVADAIALSAEQTTEVLSGWPTVRRKFVTDDDGRIFNAKLEQVRRKQRANFRKRRESGRIAGKASAAKRQAEQGLVVNDRSTTVQRPSTDKRGEERSRSDQRGGEQIPTLAARSKRPIFSGRRLTVFEWMLDDCMKTLGSLTDEFGLDEWFWKLDEQAMAAGLVIPQRDNGAWLQAQLVAEAQRRGLPIAVAGPAFGKQTSRLQAALANIKAEAS